MEELFKTVGFESEAQRAVSVLTPTAVLVDVILFYMAEHPLLWHAPTHEGTPRSTDWFWALGIVALCGAILAVLFSNILLGIIILLGAGILGVLAMRPPRDCEIELSESGVRIDTALYPYRSLKSYWVAEEEGRVPHLVVSTSSYLNPQLVLPIPEEAGAERVRVHMRKHIKEEEQYESFFSRIGEIFGF